MSAETSASSAHVHTNEASNLWVPSIFPSPCPPASWVSVAAWGLLGSSILLWGVEMTAVRSGGSAAG